MGVVSWKLAYNSICPKAQKEVHGLFGRREMSLVLQPGGERHPTFRRRLEEQAVQCAPQGSGCQCGNLLHHRDGEGQWPDPVSVSEIPF